MISLVHPSRGRPHKSLATVQHWISTAGTDVQLIVSTDHDDVTLPEYSAGYQDYMSFRSLDKFTINKNSCVVEAANHAARASDGDILVYLSDDFKCPENWGVLIEKEFEGISTPLLVKVDDGYQPFYKDVLTIPIMNRELYRQLGYFFNPIYKSMFVDQDLYHTVHNMGAMKFCEHLKFPHEHYVNGFCEKDDTYKRSDANWNSGKRTYFDRKRQKFPR